MNPAPTQVAFRCGAAARWLPRAASAAVLLASMLVAFRFDAWRSNAFGFPVQAFFILVGAAVAFWILRAGSEVQVRIVLDREQLSFSHGRRTLALALASIERFEFDHPMTASRRPLPAAVLIDDRARAWRLPSVLEAGAELIDAIVAASGREDLAAWADSLALRRRMNRAGLVTAVGYACALAVAAAGCWFYLH